MPAGVEEVFRQGYASSFGAFRNTLFNYNPES